MDSSHDNDSFPPPFTPPPPLHVGPSRTGLSAVPGGRGGRGTAATGNAHGGSVLAGGGRGGRGVVAGGPSSTRPAWADRRASGAVGNDAGRSKVCCAARI